MDGLPLLPVEEEGRLSDPASSRELHHARVRSPPSPGAPGMGTARRDVVAFHTAHKFLLLAHSPRHYAALGRWWPRMQAGARTRWLDAYAEQLMAALGVMATAKKHVNVLQHLLGFFKARLGTGGSGSFSASSRTTRGPGPTRSFRSRSSTTT